MYIRTSTRRNKSGQVVRYLQLAHNEWDGAAGVSRTRVVYSFGREDELDRVGIERLIGSLSRLLDLAAAAGLTGPVDLAFTDSRPVGGAHVLDGLWRRVGIGEAIVKTLAEQVYHQVAHLLNLEVDLLFFDTTSTYFETGEDDEPVARDAHGRVDPDGQITDPVRDVGFRTHGKSKDHRDDLPQVVVGMAVTRQGIPVRVWSWPGNTADLTLIRQVKDDMRDWSLARIVWVADRGFSSATNRRYLQRGGGHYIIGEKLRSGSADVDAVLSRQGRYATVAGNLQVKEVKVDDAGDRFILCYNHEQAERDQAVRAGLVARLTEKITDTDRWSVTKRAGLRGQISTKPGLDRFLRVTPKELLRVDAAAVKAEERLDGKYLLRSSDPKLSAEDIAVGYKQLREVERGWRDMKSVLDLRPAYHHLEDRIRAHLHPDSSRHYSRTPAT